MHSRAIGLLITALALIATLGLVGCAPAATPTAAPAAPAAPKATEAPKAVEPTKAPEATQPAPTTAAKPTAAPAASSSAEFVDDAGRKVTVKKADRIVSLSPSNTEILFALGLGDRVVGVTEYCDFPAEATAKPKVGGFSNIDAEKVVALAPDLVVAGSIHQAKVVPALEKLGLTVIIVDPKNADEVFARIESLGAVTGKAKEGKELRASLEKRAADIAMKAKGDKSTPRVFWMIGDGMFTAGPGSFINGMIEKSNAANVAADAKTQWPELSMEALLKADPEIVVVAAPEGEKLVAKLKADAAWKGVSAVKNGRFVVVDQNIVSRPGPRIVDGLELVAKGLHPEQFK